MWRGIPATASLQLAGIARFTPLYRSGDPRASRFTNRKGTLQLANVPEVPRVCCRAAHTDEEAVCDKPHVTEYSQKGIAIISETSTHQAMNLECDGIKQEERAANVQLRVRALAIIIERYGVCRSVLWSDGFKDIVQARATL